MRFAIGRKVSVGFGTALLLLSVTGMVSYQAIIHFVQEARWVEQQSLRVLKELDDVPARLMAAEIRQRNYLLAGDESELAPYHAAVETIKQEIEDLRQLTGDNPSRQQRLDALESLVAKAVAELKETLDLRRNNGVTVASQRVLGGQGKQIMTEISQMISEMEGEEKELLKKQHEILDSTAQKMIFAVIIRNVLALMFVTVSGLVVYRDISARNRTEAALRESEARLKAQYKGIPIPTYTWQKMREDLVLVDYNDAAETFTRGEMVNCLGRHASEIYKDTPEILEDFARCLTERIPIKREMPYRFLTTGEDKHLAVTCAFVPPQSTHGAHRGHHRPQAGRSGTGAAQAPARAHFAVGGRWDLCLGCAGEDDLYQSSRGKNARV